MGLPFDGQFAGDPGAAASIRGGAALGTPAHHATGDDDEAAAAAARKERAAALDASARRISDESDVLRTRAGRWFAAVTAALRRFGEAPAAEDAGDRLEQLFRRGEEILAHMRALALAAAAADRDAAALEYEERLARGRAAAAAATAGHASVQEAFANLRRAVAAARAAAVAGAPAGDLDEGAQAMDFS
ncbi:hypothetical protein ACP4OV_006587 [Aristida adscensionis]